MTSLNDFSDGIALGKEKIGTLLKKKNEVGST